MRTIDADKLEFEIRVFRRLVREQLPTSITKSAAQDAIDYILKMLENQPELKGVQNEKHI